MLTHLTEEIENDYDYDYEREREIGNAVLPVAREPNRIIFSVERTRL
jgi:hypothetical protein